MAILHFTAVFEFYILHFKNNQFYSEHFAKAKIGCFASTDRTTNLFFWPRGSFNFQQYSEGRFACFHFTTSKKLLFHFTGLPILQFYSLNSVFLHFTALKKGHFTFYSKHIAPLCNGYQYLLRYKLFSSLNFGPSRPLLLKELGPCAPWCTTYASQTQLQRDGHTYRLSCIVHCSVYTL